MTNIRDSFFIRNKMTSTLEDMITRIDTLEEFEQTFSDEFLGNDDHIGIYLAELLWKYDCKASVVSTSAMLTHSYVGNIVNGKKKNLELIRQNGFMNYCRYLDEETREASSRYAFYAQQKAPSKKELEEQKKENMKKPPLLSIAAVLWETDAADLSRFVSSLQAQSYGNWQLCLADVHSTPEVSECLSKLCRTDRRILCRHPEQVDGAV